MIGYPLQPLTVGEGVHTNDVELDVINTIFSEQM